MHQLTKKHEDAALNNLYEKLKSLVGQDIVENIYKLIILIEISDLLDYELADFLQKNYPSNCKSKKDIIPFQILEESIRLTNQYEKRKVQVELICESLTFFFALSKIPFIKLVMAPNKVAASIVNANSLGITMEEGYRIS